MDGFEQNEGIILMAAKNLPDILDPALTRPGRFDRHIVVPNPDVRGRQENLDLYLQDKPLAEDVDVKTLARGTPGFNLLYLFLQAFLIFHVGLMIIEVSRLVFFLSPG
ncbi:hypothetical protein K1719_018329 [Acacia pycnantha]|nr:hypothetical protein K1719_018329 [Acacia pycnantha]